LTPSAIEGRLMKVGYIAAKAFDDLRWIAIKMGFSHTFIVRGDLTKRDDAMWIYPSENAALSALSEWDGLGDPPRFKSKTLSAARGRKTTARGPSRAWDSPA
jgi:hypothetical protein